MKHFFRILIFKISLYIWIIIKHNSLTSLYICFKMFCLFVLFYDEFASIARYQISTLNFMRKLFRELSFKYLPPNTNQHTICYQFPWKYLRETAQKSLVSGQKVPSRYRFIKYAVAATTFQSVVVLSTVHLCFNFHQSTHKLFLFVSVAINMI